MAVSKLLYTLRRYFRINYRQWLAPVLTDVHQTVIQSIKIKTIS